MLRKRNSSLEKNKQSLSNESITLLKDHLESMRFELKETNKQIRTLSKSKKLSDWERINFQSGHSIEELRQQKKDLTKQISFVQKQIGSKSKVLFLTELALLPVVFLLLIISGIGPELVNSFPEQESFQSRYFVENLRGDTLDTWKTWRLVGTTMNVNIIAPNNISEEKISVVVNSINSMEAIEIDDSSKYYLGWKGAINDVSTSIHNTKYNLPLDFNIMTSYGGEGDIIITLSNQRDVDGYTGFTKSIVDGNEILKSFITIYDTNNLTDKELGTITRHEFGHALGLGHSTAPEDLMAPTIAMTYPYISECNVAGIVDLYNGGEGSKTTCEK